MKSLNKLKELFASKPFDLEFESQMVQSRIVSTFLEVIENLNITQKELEEKTGLSQPFISALLNNRKKLNVEHIAKLQNALGIKLKAPEYFSNYQYENEYFKEIEYTENRFIGDFNNIHNFKKTIKDKLISCYCDKFVKDTNETEDKVVIKPNKHIFEYV
jgi:transcriptional regulator with XRE-family HTH domain